jgi:hypothetical protein
MKLLKNNILFIAHRGNTTGAKPEEENKPEYVLAAISEGFYVEVDVWVNNRVITLGHDEGLYECQAEFLENDKIICHAKNIGAIEFFIFNRDIHWFWHEKDSCTLTSQGWTWCFPHIYINNSVCNQIEYKKNISKQEIVDEYLLQITKYNFHAICSDYVGMIRDAIHV